ncbi:flavodoxin [Dubosiella newyorkensis]|uniref:Flavodoxin-like domain-containing protein n=2 Tax=Dubosiella newyorkensis TaxID=1862672 RepID=A0A1U7NLM4_9FIRM|nr:flavodoxin [Dubosiella newyorkensis]OLU45748.1 hypothetical protein BO225_07775 [Dubosiella newyorkensis]
MKDTLVMYFGGNHPANSTTKRAATSIADLTGADLFEIEPKYPYSTNDDVCVQEALRDLGANARPELARPVPNIEQYSTIILGFPNWCGTAPMPVFTALDELHQKGELAGKRIVPFVINGGAGRQKSIDDLEAAYPEANIDEGSGFVSSNYDDAVDLAIEWIQNKM